MRALFVGGTVDNSELDLDRTQPPAHYPENGGSGQSRYRLHHVGLRHHERATDARDDRAAAEREHADRAPADIAYAVYAAPDMADADIQRIADERDYARRFRATPAPPTGRIA